MHEHAHGLDVATFHGCGDIGGILRLWVTGGGSLGHFVRFFSYCNDAFMTHMSVIKVCRVCQDIHPGLNPWDLEIAKMLRSIVTDPGATTTT